MSFIPTHIATFAQIKHILKELNKTLKQGLKKTGRALFALHLHIELATNEAFCNCY